MAPTADPIPAQHEVVVPGTATKAQKAEHIPHDEPLQHPLDPLSADEILAVSHAVRKHIAEKTDVKMIKFITLYLLPPPKRAVLAHLGIPLETGSKPEPKISIVRKAEIDFIDVVTGDAYNAIFAFQSNEWVFESIDKLPEGTQPQISVEELAECEHIVRQDEGVRALAAEIGIKPEEIFADGWSIGYDERFPKSLRVQQALMFARFGTHENLYAHPLDFVPVIDSNAGKVLHIDFPARYNASPNGPTLSSPDTLPPTDFADAAKHANRDRIPVPRKKFDFLPDLQAEDPGFKARDDVKPLHILQPEGVSFKMNGHELEWQKWKMHISFTHREGIALSTVTYNDGGVIRPVFYRLSLAEMVVPYAAPEYPHPRKFAFDSGEYGMGTMANELSLGCDCLGQIHYLPGAYVGHNGEAVIIKNVICIHEEDAGVLWKHTDYRPGGRGTTVRSRRLVVSMVCTLANYEYIWNYYFYQDGTVELEIRLTGILQTYVAADGEPTPYGTQVAPGVDAHYHQHIFSVRVDPMIDGLSNSVVETDIHPSSAPTGSKENFAGNAFQTHEKILKVQSEGGRQYDWAADRRWRIVNSSRKHYSSGKPSAYTIAMKGGAVPFLAKPDSWIGKRAGFTRNALWVVKDKEGAKGGRMWPAGKYVPQTREEPKESVAQWAKGDDTIENEDIVVFITVGTTHIPRPEDFPVMPVEHLNLVFKPNSFFAYNPSMDVPGSKDNHSVTAFSNGTSNGNGAHANGTNSACCSN